MPNNIPPNIPPGAKTMRISKDQLLGLIVNYLVASQVKLKGMMLVKALPNYEEAVCSSWIEDRKYGIRHLKDEQKIIFDVWVPVQGSEPQHREMLATYDDIFKTMIQYRLQSAPQVADAMFKMISERTAQEWDQILQKKDKAASKIIMPGM